MKKILIIVDPQIDFVSGSLAVPGAQQAMEKFETFAAAGGLQNYDEIVVTIDSHPVNHCSFVSEGGIFPSHCIQHNIGAAICPEVERALSKSTNANFYTKGSCPTKEEFSIFKSPYGTQMQMDMNFFRDTEIDVMGIAGDYCVHDTISDLLNGYPTLNRHVTVLTDFIASIDDGSKLKALITEFGLKTL